MFVVRVYQRSYTSGWFWVVPGSTRVRWHAMTLTSHHVNILCVILRRAWSAFKNSGVVLTNLTFASVRYPHETVTTQ